MLRIICSAVVYKGIAVAGVRHRDCNEIIKALHPEAVLPERGEFSYLPAEGKYVEVQGFMTSENKYVNRSEAYEIALAANQMLIGGNEMKTLTSEDLFGCL